MAVSKIYVRGLVDGSNQQPGTAYLAVSDQGAGVVALKISGGLPVNTVAPVISPTIGVEVGDTCTTTNGTWSGSPTSYTYLWCSAIDGTPGSATNNAQSYTFAAGDIGVPFVCKVTAHNGAGSTTATSSNQTDPVATFSPSDLGSKWLLGVIGTSLGANDSDIATWTDESPNNYSVAEIFAGFGPTVKTVGGRKVARVASGLGMTCPTFAMPAEAVIFIVASTPAAAFNSFVGTAHVNPATAGIAGQCYDALLPGTPTTNGLYPYTMKSGITLITVRIQDGYERTYENGVPRAGVTRTVASSTGLNIGCDISVANGLSGDIMAIQVTEALTDTELGKMHTWLGGQCGLLIGTQPGDPIRVRTVGDSIMAGFDGTSQQTDTIAVRLQAALGSGYVVENVSYNGRTLDDILSNAPNQIYPFGEGSRNIIIPWEYYNVRLELAATIFSTYSSLCTATRSAGTRVLLPNDFHSDPNIPAASALVTAGAAGFSDAFADLNLQSLRDDVAGTDGVHLDAAGWDIVVGVLTPIVQGM